MPRQAEMLADDVTGGFYSMIEEKHARTGVHKIWIEEWKYAPSQPARLATAMRFTGRRYGSGLWCVLVNGRCVGENLKKSAAIRLALDSVLR